ncbi:MAG: NAD(P)H-dependent oxidoreductase [Cyclobacteriaceae bacterium]|nr:NAD(P)H-dependent oxidoreductase [Cyclobacteriaceae bacterium]
MITIIVGTNRMDSVSQQVALEYAEVLKVKGAESTILNLRNLPEDFITSALYENAGKNEQFNQMRSLMNDSEKFIFVIPEYNGSFPGVLKAFIDGLDRASLTDKKCALIGLSAGDQGAGLALSHFTDIMNYCGTNVLAYRLRFPKIGEILTDNKISDQLYLSKIHKQARKLIEF